MVSPQDDIGNPAQNALQVSGSCNANIYPNLDVSQTYSINTSVRPEYVISEDIFAGQRMNGKMSSIRRFFCLFVTFDLLFITLMWLICIMLNGDNIWIAVNKEIKHYNIHTSLFDIVSVAACRFIILILFYAALYINHWIIISLSTGLTCAFLIVKVFVFNWQNSPQPVFQVLLVLISFVISWGEAWFLDFRVIPQEIHAQQFIISSPDSERTPLIRSYVQGLPSMYSESVANFYSPLGTPEGSLHKVEVNNEFFHSEGLFTQDQVEHYKIKGSKILKESWNLLNNPGWKLEKQMNNDSIYSLTLPKIGKIFKLIALVNVPPRLLLDELFYNVENIPKWNPTLLKSHKILSVDEHTDISYQISAEGAAGAVKSRDFITLRHWGMIDECYVIGNVGMEHSSIPINEKYTRGENGVGCWVMRPTDSTETCYFEWVLNSDLKGWIPQYILDKAFVKMMFDYIKYLRDYLIKIKEAGQL